MCMHMHMCMHMCMCMCMCMCTQSFPALCSVETVSCQMTLVPKNEAFTACLRTLYIAFRIRPIKKYYKSKHLVHVPKQTVGTTKVFNP